MKCDNCENEIPVGTEFCPHCGAKIAPQETNAREIARALFPEMFDNRIRFLKSNELSCAKNVFVGKDISMSDISRFKDYESSEVPKVFLAGKGLFFFNTGILITDKKLHFISHDVRGVGAFLGITEKMHGSVLLRGHQFSFGDEIEIGSPPAYMGNEFYIDGKFKGWIRTDKTPCLSIIPRSTKGLLFISSLLEFVSEFNKEYPLK